jgi:DNA-binding MarR family transcriptional regulator
MRETINYLKESFGLDLEVKQITNQEYSVLPLYLRGSYECYRGQLSGQDLIWAKVKESENLTPDQLQKQENQLTQILKSRVVFVFDKLESWQRKRLIQKRVPFVQPFKQIYLPQLLIQLNDSFRSEENRIESISNCLSYPAQCAILYHLEVTPIENIPFQEIAALLNYSAMTISRIVKELVHFELATVKGGKEKSLLFKLIGKELWQNIVPILSNPIREIWFTDQIWNNNQFRISGDSALSNYTMLSSGTRKTYAIGKDEFRSMKTLGAIKNWNKINGDNVVEVWHYNPSLLSNKSEVDRLSLYLTLTKEEDERVKRALQDLINDIKW